MSQKDIITRMLSKSFEERPTLEECLQAVTCLTHEPEYTGTTNTVANENKNEDSSPTANCCPKTPDEMDQTEITSSDRLDSLSPSEDELSVREMTPEQDILLSLDMSDGEQQAEAAEEVAEKEVIQGKRPSNTPKAVDQNVNWGNPQQHIKVKKSSNTADQRIYDKRNYCIYCEKSYAKITRHLKQKHSDKAEVAKALAYNQGSSMRNLLLSKVFLGGVFPVSM